ncbi:hypothetical protein [Streptomyces sp. NPDC048644]|uniref:hypothetical protein n=1 Tax=Streptomyces sp. NPDC048644 TaxID=3365582 RepID=UPI003711D9AC
MSQGEVTTSRIVISDDLPDGMLVLPVERRGEMLWLVRRGHITKEAADALNLVIEHQTQHGLWRRSGEPDWARREDPS